MVCRCCLFDADDSIQFGRATLGFLYLPILARIG